MRLLIITILVLLCGLIPKSWAQNIQIMYQPCTLCPQAARTQTPFTDPLYGYGAATPFVTGDIESDFDLRHLNSSRWPT